MMRAAWSPPLEHAQHGVEVRAVVRPWKVYAVLGGLLAPVLGVGGHDDGQHALRALVERGDALWDDAVEHLPRHARLA